MRELLLLVGLLLALGAVGALAAALASRELRVRRRAAVDAGLAAATTPGRRARRRSRGLSGEVRRAVLLELADRVSSETLRAQAPAVRRTLSQAESDLNSPRWVRRCRGLRTLMTVGLPVPPLLRLLADRSPRVRSLACAAAADRDEPELMFALVRLLSDPHPLVRFSALDAVSRRGSAVVDALGRALDDTPLLRLHELEGPERGDRADRRAGPGQHRARRWPRRERRSARPQAVPAVPEAAPGAVGTLPRPLAPSSRTDLPTRRVLLLLQAAAASAEPGLAAAVRPFAGDARAGPRCRRHRARGPRRARAGPAAAARGPRRPGPRRRSRRRRPHRRPHAGRPARRPPARPRPRRAPGRRRRPRPARPRRGPGAARRPARCRPVRRRRRSRRPRPAPARGRRRGDRLRGPPWRPSWPACAPWTCWCSRTSCSSTSCSRCC